MPRARSPARDKAFEIYKEYKERKEDITNRTIADMLDVSEKTVGGWKCKDNWDKKLNGESEESNGVLQTNERSTPKEKNIDTTVKRNGNPNPENQFTERNQTARKHGLYANYFTESQRAIMDDFEDVSIVEQLWLQIKIKFSAIIQLQKVMWVENSEDHLKEVSGNGESTTYKVAFAYERYESYIKAQTRAMAEYRNLIKQFLYLAPDGDKRCVEAKLMQLDVDKKHADIVKAQSEAAVVKNKADKLTASGESNKLLQALIDVRKGGNGSGDESDNE